MLINKKVFRSDVILVCSARPELPVYYIRWGNVSLAGVQLTDYCSAVSSHAEPLNKAKI